MPIDFTADYLRRRPEVDVYLAEQDALAERLRQEIEARFPSAGLRQKLEARFAERRASA